MDPLNDAGILSQLSSFSSGNDFSSKRENRVSFAALVGSYYTDRLKLESPKGALSRLLQDPMLIEASHGAQLPHLGIVRLYAKSADLARKSGNGLALFFVGDQYSANMYAETTRIHFPSMNAPILMPVPDKRKPTRLLPPPNEKAILAVKNKVLGSFGANLNKFLSANSLPKGGFDKEFFTESLGSVIEIMLSSAKLVSNYADWCTRVQLLIFQRTNPELYENYALFFPIWDLRQLSSWPELLSKYPQINSFKNSVSQKQAASGLEPYQKAQVEPNLSPLWYYCPKCSEKSKGFIAPDGSCQCTCPNCKNVFTEPLGSANSSPDIVFSQILTALHLGVSARVVGHVHSYAGVADSFLKETYGQSPPIRFTLSSHPVFHGIGDDASGESRCSIIRAAIEAEPGDIGAALESDWSTGPVIRSHFHKALAGVK